MDAAERPIRLARTFDPSTMSLPIVQAPMAGGPSTPELAIAV
jgi:NAD(P)H-dependent flavin oxidoreductase YrpB (nitropropane dioxygenase family)